MESKKQIFITFDIDGTVVIFDNNVKLHHQCFQQAISEMFRPIGDPSSEIKKTVYGWMDRNIIGETIKAIGFEASEENIQKCIKRSEDLFKEKFTAKPIIPPGVERILKELSEMPNVTIALGSGNLEGIAWKKLDNANLTQYFKDRIGGFGDTCLSRAECLMKARQKAEQIKGHPFDIIIHVGDMETDVDSAHEVGAIAVAVRTGRSEGITFKEPVYDFENLEVCHDQFMELLK